MPEFQCFILFTTLIRSSTLLPSFSISIGRSNFTSNWFYEFIVPLLTEYLPRSPRVFNKQFIEYKLLAITPFFFFHRGLLGDQSLITFLFEVTNLDFPIQNSHPINFAGQ